MFIREIRAGKFIKRIATNIKPKGGASYEWLYEETGEIDRRTGEIEKKRTNDYFVYSTGEIKTSEGTAESRTANMRNVRNACERFKWLVRANGEDARLFITLTYAENMTDTKQLYEDFRRFWQKFKRAYPCKGYLVAFEPQERGAWHAHIITLGGAEFIPNDTRPKGYSGPTIAELWGHGNTKTKQCQRVADLGSYLTSYLTKLDGKKGSRLNLYPARFRFLRWSKGVKMPEMTQGTSETMEGVDETKFVRSYEKNLEKELSPDLPKMKIQIIEWTEKTTYDRYLFFKKKKSKQFFTKNNTPSCLKELNLKRSGQVSIMAIIGHTGPNFQEGLPASILTLQNMRSDAFPVR